MLVSGLRLGFWGLGCGALQKVWRTMRFQESGLCVLEGFERLKVLGLRAFWVSALRVRLSKIVGDPNIAP